MRGEHDKTVLTLITRALHSARNVQNVPRMFRVSAATRSSSCAKGPPSRAVFFNLQILVVSSYSEQTIFMTLPSRSVAEICC